MIITCLLHENYDEFMIMRFYPTQKSIGPFSQIESRRSVTDIITVV